MATRRRLLLQGQSLLAQQAIRGAIAKPRTLPSPSPHRRFLHTAAESASASAAPSLRLLWRGSGSLLPMSAAAARTVAARWAAARAAAPLELFSLQRRVLPRTGREPSGELASKIFRIVPWARAFFNPDVTVLTLVTANVAVFMLWRLADPTFMQKHFMISLDNFKSGRLHTMLTSAFSHIQSGHLISNMIGLFFFGQSIAKIFGPRFLLSLYTAGAFTGSAFFLLDKAFIASREQASVGWDKSRAPALGASAAVNAIVLLNIFLYPKQLIYVYFILPVPAALVGAALIGADLWSANKGQSGTSGSAHLGGVLVAALMWARIRKGWI